MAKILKNNLDDLVYEKVKDMILKGILKPGEVIVQSQLASELGVSRTPLRKALSQLEKESLVKVTERDRMVVREFTLDEMFIILEIRARIEGLSARLAANRVDVSWLYQIQQQYEKAVAEGDVQLYRNVDVEFHTRLAQYSETSILSELTNNFCVLSIALAQGLLREPSETIDEHRALIQALAAGDGRNAERLMIEHIRKTIDKMQTPNYLSNGSMRDANEILLNGYSGKDTD